MWDLLFQKISNKLRNDENDASEKTIYLEVGRRIIEQLKLLGVNAYRYASHLEVFSILIVIFYVSWYSFYLSM